MHQFRRVKVIATLGPASRNLGMIKKMVRAGVDVFRINGAHGDEREHRETIIKIRRVSKDLGQPTAILFDLPGPKLRLGNIHPDVIVLRRRQKVVLFHGRRSSSVERIPVPSAMVFNVVKKGQSIFINDGLVHLRVVSGDKKALTCEVLSGGEIRSGKGLNLPSAKLVLPSLTARDRKLLVYAIKSGVDFIGLSFVRDGKTVQSVRRRMHHLGSRAEIIAKIENQQALTNANEIIEAADGVMIARGDLGIEIAYSQVPVAQREIVRIARKHAKPVITATQMLLSMVNSPRPTRAEANDVANTVWSGADGLMLSEETSVGTYPQQAVQAMTAIIEAAEADSLFEVPRSNRSEGKEMRAISIGRAAVMLAKELKAAVIVVPTRSGRAPRYLSNARVMIPILALTSSDVVARRMRLVWGVRPVLIRKLGRLDQLLAHAEAAARASKLLRKHDTLVITSGAHGEAEDILRLIEVRKVS